VGQTFPLFNENGATELTLLLSEVDVQMQMIPVRNEPEPEPVN
jgi:hypothetical protein